MRWPIRWQRDEAAARVGRAELSALARRSREVLVVAGTVGVLVGLVVAGFENITGEGLLELVVGLPLWMQAVAPTIGLTIAAVLLRVGGRRTTPSTSDEYIRAFHEAGGLGRVSDLLKRVGAAVATLGTGAPLGYEGPALYAGAGVGRFVHQRLRGRLHVADGKVLLVAGAAAGVAAIFKAPVTGLVFALEVPYQDDLARRMLLPAATSAAASYVTFAAIAGTEPLLPIGGQPPFNLPDLGGAALVGVACGVLARAFTAVVRAAKALADRGHPALRIGLGGSALALTVLLAQAVEDGELALGPGYHVLDWAIDPQTSLLAIVALGTIRVAGTAATLGAGGAGGLFIPLVIQGALVGRVVGGALHIQTGSLLPVVGMAAFLGAGYRVPLAAVVFVAEFTGRSSFVVPGLIAAVVAQLVIGSASVSPYQRSGRVGHLEHRLQLPLRSVIDSDAATVGPETTIDEVFWDHLVGARQQGVVVVDGDAYLGLVRAVDLGDLDRAHWSTRIARDVMRTDVPVAATHWTLADAMRALDASGSDRMAVCDGATYVGVISMADLLALEALFDADQG